MVIRISHGLIKVTILTSSLVSDSIVDTFVVVYKFVFDFSLFHRKVDVAVICCTSDYSNNTV